MPRIALVGLTCSTFMILLVVVGRAPGAGANGSRRRVGAIDIQQRVPNLSYDQGRRQSPGPEPAQYHQEGKPAPYRTSAIPVL